MVATGFAWALGVMCWSHITSYHSSCASIVTREPESKGLKALRLAEKSSAGSLVFGPALLSSATRVTRPHQDELKGQQMHTETYIEPTHEELNAAGFIPYSEDPMLAELEPLIAELEAKWATKAH